MGRSQRSFYKWRGPGYCNILSQGKGTRLLGITSSEQLKHPRTLTRRTTLSMSIAIGLWHVTTHRSGQLIFILLQELGLATWKARARYTRHVLDKERSDVSCTCPLRTILLLRKRGSFWPHLNWRAGLYDADTGVVLWVLRCDLEDVRSRVEATTNFAWAHFSIGKLRWETDALMKRVAQTFRLT